MFYVVAATPLTARSKYIFDWLLGEQWGLTWQAALPAQLPADAVGIQYDREPLVAGLPFFKASGWLHTDRLFAHTPEVAGGQIALFPHNDHRAALGYDPFAAIFWYLTRYEEYQPYSADLHGRFPASASLSYRQGWLHIPVADSWLYAVGEVIKHYFPALVLPAQPFLWQPTYDIDMAWAYRHKGVRGAVAALRRYAAGDARAMRVLAGNAPDPYFTFDWIRALHHTHGGEPLFFWLLGQYNAFNKNTSPRHPALQTLIGEIAAEYKTGLHPSYVYHSEALHWQREKQALESITRAPVERTRQHFLRLRLPDTYRTLLELGFTADYTMGYADQVGFRAGTSRSFFWFDLAANAATSLRLYPFQAMDVALRQYLHYSPSQAVAALAALADTVRRYGGTFTTLWHNSSLCECEGWQGWRAVYESLVKN